MHTAQVTALCTHAGPGLGIAAHLLNHVSTQLLMRQLLLKTVIIVWNPLYWAPCCCCARMCMPFAGMKRTAHETDLHQIVITR